MVHEAFSTIFSSRNFKMGKKLDSAFSLAFYWYMFVQFFLFLTYTSFNQILAVLKVFLIQLT